MKEKNISNFLLEQYILKELPAKKISEIDSICKQRPDILERINEIKKSNTDILEKYPVSGISENITAAYGRRGVNSKSNFVLAFNFKAKPGMNEKKMIDFNYRKKIYKRLILSSAGLAVAAVIVFYLPVIDTNFNKAPDGIQGTDRVKGDTTLYIYRKNNNTIDDLHSGSMAKNGDLLQIAYLSVKDKYGIILSIDGRGTVTLHYPSGNNNSTALSTGRKVPLSNSYQLDDAPGFERFFFITSESSLNVNEVMNAAKSISLNREKVLDENVKLVNKSDGVNQVSIKIIKENQK